MSAPLPHGIITVLNTPFTRTNEVDCASLERNVLRAVDAGVAGFLVPALAAEVFELSPDERADIVRTVIRTAPAGLSVIGSATAATEHDRIRYARRLGALGCAAVLVALDSRSAESEDAIVKHLQSLSDAAGVPLVLQDWAPSGPGLALRMIERIAVAVPAVTGLKIEVVPSGPKFTACRTAFGTRFHLSGGWTVLQLIEALDRGVDAFMPTGLHELYVSIDHAYRSGNRDRAVEVFHRLTPVLAFSNQHLETSIHFFKELLAFEGTYDTARCRIGTANFDAYHAAVAAELVRYAVSLRTWVKTGTPAGEQGDGGQR